MKHERMKVLEMLEAGKITAEEATKLLEAMKGGGQDREIHGFAFSGDTDKQVEEKLNRFTQGVDNFAREFGSKVDVLYRELEPKVKKASQTVLEKTAAVFDEISKSLNESLENARKSAECQTECNPPCEAECESVFKSECQTSCEAEAATETAEAPPSEEGNCGCGCGCDCEDDGPKEN